MIVTSKIKRITRRKLVVARGVQPPRKIRLAIQAMLQKGLVEMAADYEKLAGELALLAPKEAIKQLRQKWRGFYEGQSVALAEGWVDAIVDQSKEQFKLSVSRAVGIDVTAILDGESVRSAGESMATDAAQLIRTIPENYLDQVQEAVWMHYQQFPQPEGRTLLEQIRHIGKVSENRAKLIARDQTSKINIAVLQARNEEAGIKEYIWRTARDGRVVGNPSGLYPKAVMPDVHGNHYAREGKKFRWDSPPEDSHPGYAINCRCTAEPVIDMNNLQIVFG